MPIYISNSAASLTLIFEFKDSLYHFSCTLAHFLTYLEITCISCYTLSEQLKFALFKIDKIALNHLNGEEDKQFKNEESEAFKRVSALLL